MLQQLLLEESILLHLDAPNREAALAETIAKLPSSQIPAKEKATILELVLQRELFGTTAIGEGIALPHCFSSVIEAPISVLGISRKGVNFQSLDGQPAHLIFLTVFPEKLRGSLTKQTLLKEAETVLQDRFLRERLKIAETAEEAFEVFSREAQHLTEISQNRLRHSA